MASFPRSHTFVRGWCAHSVARNEEPRKSPHLLSVEQAPQELNVSDAAIRSLFEAVNLEAFRSAAAASGRRPGCSYPLPQGPLQERDNPSREDHSSDVEVRNRPVYLPPPLECLETFFLDL